MKKKKNIKKKFFNLKLKKKEEISSSSFLFIFEVRVYSRVDDLVLFNKLSEGLRELLLDSLAVLRVPSVRITTAECSVVRCVVKASNREIEHLSIAFNLDSVGAVALLEEVVKVITSVVVVHNPLRDSVVEAQDELLCLRRHTTRNSIDSLLSSCNVLRAAHLRSDRDIEDAGSLKNFIRQDAVAVLVAVRDRKRVRAVVWPTAREFDKDCFSLECVGYFSILALKELADVVLEDRLDPPENAGRETA